MGHKLRNEGRLKLTNAAAGVRIADRRSYALDRGPERRESRARCMHHEIVGSIVANCQQFRDFRAREAKHEEYDSEEKQASHSCPLDSRSAFDAPCGETNDERSYLATDSIGWSNNVYGRTPQVRLKVLARYINCVVPQSE
jgi:hypothetical protein